MSAALFRLCGIIKSQDLTFNLAPALQTTCSQLTVVSTAERTTQPDRRTALLTPDSPGPFLTPCPRGARSFISDVKERKPPGHAAGFGPAS